MSPRLGHGEGAMAVVSEGAGAVADAPGNAVGEAVGGSAAFPAALGLVVVDVVNYPGELLRLHRPGAVALWGELSSVNPGVPLALRLRRTLLPQLARGPLVISVGDTVPSSSIRSPTYGPACSLKMRTASWLRSG